MAQRGIREFNAKRMLADTFDVYDGEVALVGPEDNILEQAKELAWLKNKRLVVKPDQLFGKRGKHGLIAVDLSLDEAKKWIAQRMNTTVTVSGIEGELTHFIVEPFVPHDSEYYVSIRSSFEGDTIYLSNEGGVNVEENWDKVASVEILAGADFDVKAIESKSAELFGKDKDMMIDFIERLYGLFAEGNFSYLEINPLTIVDGKVIPLDTVAKLDDTAEFECREIWGDIEFPIAFGRTFGPEEAFINELDAKTGASLKLSVLKPDARIWTMVAGGGASVIYADTISDLGFGNELANYGEYSGNPNTEMTYHYAKTILDLMTRKKAADGKKKILFIGGGIANFTDVAKTFTGIIKALREFAPKLKEYNVDIYVRRGGPNYKVGLEQMSKIGAEIGVPIKVYGPETHMTHIVSLALA